MGIDFPHLRTPCRKCSFKTDDNTGNRGLKCFDFQAFFFSRKAPHPAAMEWTGRRKSYWARASMAKRLFLLEVMTRAPWPVHGLGPWRALTTNAAGPATGANALQGDVGARAP